MALAALRVGIVIFVVGFFSFFFTQSYVLTSLITSIGFLFFIIGVIFWSLETNGDISLS